MNVTRRSFVKSAAVVAMPLIVPSTVFGDNAPSERITIGCIGMGGHGVGYNLRAFLTQADAQVVTVCDVYKNRSENAQKIVNGRYRSTGCKALTDFREVIADPSIDAIVISTPDHWHVPMSIMALEAGKDVFSEKPTLTIAQGRELINAVKSHDAVFQAGIEDRSVTQYHRMIELLRNGAIGNLQQVNLTLLAGTVFPLEEEIPVPEGLNYELYVGPAEYIPYTRTRTGPQQWRNTFNFSNGKLLDWGAHLVDTAQLAANAPEVCPVEIEAEGTIPENSMTTVPVTYDIKYRYSNGVKMHVKSGGNAIRLTGDKGWIGNKSWRAQLEASDPAILDATYTPETSKHWLIPPSEHRNFLDCVKSRQSTTYTAETLNHLSDTLHMGDIAIRLGRKLQWDAASEAFVDDDAANAMRSRESRNDWKTKG
jgi:predicted dehydrogenase